tara:strand:- start:7273 stop:7464 length:192 start_codon:yes stop_codon:yes gene_type:complete
MKMTKEQRKNLVGYWEGFLNELYKGDELYHAVSAEIANEIADKTDAVIYEAIYSDTGGEDGTE